MPAPEVADPAGLEPVMSLTAKVVYFKVVKAGNGVSYGHLWKPGLDTRVVTVPVGYGDGYPRALTNKSELLIRGRRVPVVGAVCMDQLMADLGPAGEAYNGDTVTLIGAEGGERIAVEELAGRAGTISYEILTGLNARIPRRYAGGAS
jgi:alanine racemase